MVCFYLMDTKYRCTRCSSNFGFFKDLVKHFKDVHEARYIHPTDARSYSGDDSGCEMATNELGYPSLCYECPFPQCAFDEPGFGVKRMGKLKRNERIRKSQLKTSELAKEFGLSIRTIQRVTKSR